MLELVRVVVFRRWENPEDRVVWLRIISVVVFLGGGLGWACAFLGIRPGIPAIAFGAVALLFLAGAHGILEMRFSNVPPVPTSAQRAETAQDSDAEDKARREYVRVLLLNRDSSKSARKMALTR